MSFTFSPGFTENDALSYFIWPFGVVMVTVWSAMAGPAKRASARNGSEKGRRMTPKTTAGRDISTACRPSPSDLAVQAGLDLFEDHFVADFVVIEQQQDAADDLAEFRVVVGGERQVDVAGQSL